MINTSVLLPIMLSSLQLNRICFFLLLTNKTHSGFCLLMPYAQQMQETVQKPFVLFILWYQSRTRLLGNHHHLLTNESKTNNVSKKRKKIGLYFPLFICNSDNVSLMGLAVFAIHSCMFSYRFLVLFI